MTGGQRLGHWEVKNCNSFKALAVCEQCVSSYHDVFIPLPHVDFFAPCKDGWESNPGLQHCYKVRNAFQCQKTHHHAGNLTQKEV